MPKLITFSMLLIWVTTTNAQSYERCDILEEEPLQGLITHLETEIGELAHNNYEEFKCVAETVWISFEPHIEDENSIEAYDFKCRKYSEDGSWSCQKRIKRSIKYDNKIIKQYGEVPIDKAIEAIEFVEDYSDDHLRDLVKEELEKLEKNSVTSLMCKFSFKEGKQILAIGKVEETLVIRVLGTDHILKCDNMAVNLYLERVKCLLEKCSYKIARIELFRTGMENWLWNHI